MTIFGTLLPVPKTLPGSGPSAGVVAVRAVGADCAFQIRNGLGNDRLGDRKTFGRSRHAFPLHHGEKNMHITQFQPSPDPIRPIHSTPHTQMAIV